MENPKAQALQRIKEANNVLVTVSANPSVDQLAGAIGLTLMLNKLGKHATAVFSGNVPSTIEFLKPEDTLEKNTDSLRDFIIALDKSKADKLRYKVEDQHVKIFITPYKTSISQDDLEFSQGDFNVDVVVALGVHEQKDLDSAITAHGRILHDATVVSVNTVGNGELGSINWLDEKSSSLCEMMVTVGETLKNDIFDAQMSTALLTGIVAETERFSNKKTTSATMAVSAKLMAAGANQQLVATKLQPPPLPPQKQSKSVENKANLDSGTVTVNKEEAKKESDQDTGSLSIDHGIDLNILDDVDDTPPISQINIDNQGSLHRLDGDNSPSDDSNVTDEATGSDENSNEAVPKTPKLIEKPPILGGRFTANTEPEELESTSDPLTSPSVDEPLLSHDDSKADKTLEDPYSDRNLSYLPSPDEPKSNLDSLPSDAKQDDKTLDEIESSILNSDDGKESPPVLDNLRQEVDQASATGPDNSLPQPNLAVGSTPMDVNLGHDQDPATFPAIKQNEGQYLDVSKIDTSTGLPSNLVPADSGLPTDNTSAVEDPTAPPSGPPPMMPSSMPTAGQQPLPNAENDNQSQDPLAPL